MVDLIQEDMLSSYLHSEFLYHHHYLLQFIACNIADCMIFTSEGYLFFYYRCICYIENRLRLTRLSILLAQIKAGNNSSKLKNEIRQILYLLDQHNEITKKDYNKRSQNFLF